MDKLITSYRYVALTLLTTVIAILALNLMLYWLDLLDGDSGSNPVSDKYGQSVVNSVYPEMDEREILALLDETWSRPYRYEPFTQFKEKVHRGIYVNVNPHGFRRTKHQGSWPPKEQALNIFLYGGSTMFGYGVADDQTVASHLQRILKQKLGSDVRVYNFGRGHYYSTQERIQFENTLAIGITPDVALFVDGLNDFYYRTDKPLYTASFSKLVRGDRQEFILDSFYADTAIGRAVRRINKSLAASARESERREMAADTDSEFQDNSRYNDTEVLDTVIQRYLQNKKLIEAASSSFGVKPIFVWQPVPTYLYDQQYHPFTEGGYGLHTYSRFGYKRMAELLHENPLGNNFLWAADMQKDAKEALYVDKVHYSSSFSEDLAERIADMMIARSLLTQAAR